ncbi:MAG: septum formation initiator family protein [Candidatus Omnitrophota bacterium]
MLIKIIRKYFFFIIIIVLGFISLISVYSRYQDLAQENIELKNKMQQVSMENKALMERQYKLQNDPVFAESVARDKLRVAQEGEVIYKILPEE